MEELGAGLFALVQLIFWGGESGRGGLAGGLRDADVCLVEE